MSNTSHLMQPEPEQMFATGSTVLFRFNDFRQGVQGRARHGRQAYVRSERQAGGKAGRLDILADVETTHPERWTLYDSRGRHEGFNSALYAERLALAESLRSFVEGN